MPDLCGFSEVLLSTAAFVGFAAWIVVVGRMTNIGYPMHKRILTFLWAVAVLAMGVVDVMAGSHFHEPGLEMLDRLVMLFIRIGIIVLAVVRYHEIEHQHRDAIVACPFESPRSPEQRSHQCSTHAVKVY